MNCKDVVSGLVTIVLNSVIAFNIQNAVAADDINTNKAGTSSPAQKNQPTDLEKTVIKYIKGLKEDLPDHFLEGGYPGFFDSNFKTKDCIVPEEYRDMLDSIAKDYEKCSVLYFMNEQGHLYAIGIAYKIVGDKKPEIGGIGVVDLLPEGPNYIFYFKMQEGIFRKVEHRDGKDYETVVSKSDLKDYQGVLKILQHDVQKSEFTKKPNK